MVVSARSHRDWFEKDPAYADVPTELRSAGNLGVTLIRAKQPAGVFARAGAPELSLNIILSGSGIAQAQYGGTSFTSRFRPGLCALAPADADLVYDTHGAIDSLVVLLPQKSVAKCLAESCHGLPIDFGRLHCGTFDDAFISAVGERLWQEASKGDALGTLFVDQAVRSLLLAMRRAAGDVVTFTPTRGGLAAWQQKRVCDFLQADLTADLGLADLAELLGLSAEHFCRAFKASTGLPPHAWLVARRVERARELLETTGLSVEEIAAQVGYAEPSHLARMFRRAHGVSPTQYRRERRS